MTKKEKEILRKAIERKEGLLSPTTLINGIAEHDRRAVENLVAKKYFMEVQRDHKDINGGFYTINFYRITEKGLFEFAPWYQKIWIVIRGDVRTVIITIITAFITTLMTMFIEKIFH